MISTEIDSEYEQHLDEYYSDNDQNNDNDGHLTESDDDDQFMDDENDDDGDDNDDDEADQVFENIDLAYCSLFPNGAVAKIIIGRAGQQVKMEIDILHEYGDLPHIDHLPDGFLEGQSIEKFFFLGYYCADGIHNRHDKNLCGFGFRSTECIHLLKFVTSVLGLTYIVLKFRAVTLHSFNTGHCGNILWQIKQEGFDTFFRGTGLSSSNIIDADLDLLADFLGGNDENSRLKFAVLLLGFISGDGHVATGWRGDFDDASCALDGMLFGARSRDILVWFDRMLQRFGCTAGEITLDAAENHRILIPIHGNNKALLMDGLQEILNHGIPLDGKLRLLAELLVRERISEGTRQRRLGQRQSFANFTGDQNEDNTEIRNVLAQDFYFLNIFTINELLQDAFGLPTVNSVWEYDLRQHLNHLQQADVESNSITTFVNLQSFVYRIHLQQRMLPTMEPINGEFDENHSPFARCLGCNQVYRQEKTQRHIDNSHCPPGTAKRREHISNLGKLHWYQITPLPPARLLDENADGFLCPHSTCNHVTSQRYSILYHYYYKHVLSPKQETQYHIQCQEGCENRYFHNFLALATHYQNMHHMTWHDSYVLALQHEEAHLIQLGGSPFVPFLKSPKFTTTRITKRIVGQRLHQFFGPEHPAAMAPNQVERLEQQEDEERKQQQMELQNEIYTSNLINGIIPEAKDIYRRVVGADGRVMFQCPFRDCKALIKQASQVDDHCHERHLSSGGKIKCSHCPRDSQGEYDGHRGVESHIGYKHRDLQKPYSARAIEIIDAHYEAVGLPSYQEQITFNRELIWRAIAYSHDGYID